MRQGVKMLKRKYGKVQLMEKDILYYFIIKKLNMTKIALELCCSVPSIKKILNFYGIDTSLKGKPKSLEHRIKLSQNAKINPNYGMRGKTLSKDAREKLSKKALGRPRLDILGDKNPMWKVNRSLEWRENQRKVRSLQIMPINDTKIEVKIQNFLTQMQVEYLAHKYISDIEHKYCCDIFIPSKKIVIECDGDYWHGNPLFYSEKELTKKQKEQKERDKFRDLELKERGYRVIRLWENEIKVMELNDLKNKIEVCR